MQTWRPGSYSLIVSARISVLGVAAGGVLDLLVSEDHRPPSSPARKRGSRDSASTRPRTKFTRLAPALGGHGVAGKLGENHDFHSLAVGEEVADQVLARLVPAADQDVSTRLHGLDPPVFPAPVLDDEGGQLRRETAEDADAQHHQEGAHHPALGGHRRVVPVADGRRRHDRPPQAVAEGAGPLSTRTAPRRRR